MSFNKDFNYPYHIINLTVSGFGSKIRWIKDFAPTGNQDGHENAAFSI